LDGEIGLSVEDGKKPWRFAIPVGCCVGIAIRAGLHMHRLEEAGAGQMRQPSRVVAIGLVGRKRLERLVGLPALDADREGRVGPARRTGPAPSIRSRIRSGDNLALSPTQKRSLAPSTPSCSRKRPRLPGRERRYGFRPSRCRGQQNSPLNGLLFQSVADPVGLRGRVPAHYPMLRRENRQPVAGAVAGAVGFGGFSFHAATIRS
jgi:hypothetical protein